MSGLRIGRGGLLMGADYPDGVLKGPWRMLSAFDYMRGNPNVWPHLAGLRARTEPGIAFHTANGGVNGEIKGVAVSPDNRFMAVAFHAASGALPSIFMFDQDRFLGVVLSYSRVAHPLLGLAFSPDGRFLLFQTEENLYSLPVEPDGSLSPSGGDLLNVLGTFWSKGMARAPTFTSDGKYLNGQLPIERNLATGGLTRLTAVRPDVSDGDASEYGNSNEFDAFVAPDKTLIAFPGSSGFDVNARLEFYGFADGTTTKTSMTSQVVYDNGGYGSTYSFFGGAWTPDSRYFFTRRGAVGATQPGYFFLQLCKRSGATMPNFAWPAGTAGAAPVLGASTLMEVDDDYLYLRNAGVMRRYKHSDDSFAASAVPFVPDDGWDFQIDVKDLASQGGPGTPRAIWKNTGLAYPTVQRIYAPNAARI